MQVEILTSTWTLCKSIQFLQTAHMSSHCISVTTHLSPIPMTAVGFHCIAAQIVNAVITVSLNLINVPVRFLNVFFTLYIRSGTHCIINGDGDNCSFSMWSGRVCADNGLFQRASVLFSLSHTEHLFSLSTPWAKCVLGHFVNWVLHVKNSEEWTFSLSQDPFPECFPHVFQLLWVS